MLTEKFTHDLYTVSFVKTVVTEANELLACHHSSSSVVYDICFSCVIKAFLNIYVCYPLGASISRPGA